MKHTTNAIEDLGKGVSSNKLIIVPSNFDKVIFQIFGGHLGRVVSAFF